ncbi:MAG: extracellular solute-binding protein [Oscillospiraceae bacterium]|nr:extracellular solute-binding protein [Oscillospiraceae bacterium]
MKKTLSLLVALLLVASLFSFSAAAEEPITLKWAMWDYNSTAYYKAIADAYKEANPNVTIEFVDLGSADYNASLTTQLTGGESYDLISVKDTPCYMLLIDGEHIIDLTEYIAASEVRHATAYDGPYTYEGKLYQLPWRADPWALFYNKDMFDAIGVEYPKLGITFPEYDALVKEVGDKLAQLPSDSPYAGKKATFYHGWRSTIQMFSMTPYGESSTLFLGGGYEFLRPYYEAILAQMENGYALTWPDATAIGARYDNNFVSQDFAMTNMGTWLVTNILSKEGYGSFEWGITSYPVAEGVDKQVTPATATGIAVASASTKKDAAFEFAAWLAGPEGAAVLAGTGAFTAYVDENVADILFSAPGFPQDEVSKKAVAPDIAFIEQPILAGATQLSAALDLGNNAIMKEGASIDEGLAIMSEGVADVLAGLE